MIDQVRTIIFEYLGGRFPAEELLTRLPDPWELDEAADDVARETAMLAVGFLAEMERGDRSEAELRLALTTLVAEPASALTGPSKGEIDAWAEPNQHAGTGLRAVPA
jgi:hypothetical protein